VRHILGNFSGHNLSNTSVRLFPKGVISYHRNEALANSPRHIQLALAIQLDVHKRVRGVPSHLALAIRQSKDLLDRAIGADVNLEGLSLLFSVLAPGRNPEKSVP
jgi:hypothetical protein